MTDYSVLAGSLGTPRPKTAVEPQFKPEPRPRTKRKGLPPRSPKRVAEAEQRREVRDRVIARDRGQCIPSLRGLPGDCGSPFPDRPLREVHEFRQRSTHPGSHLRMEDCMTTCQLHHDMVTSPVGELRELVEALGLIERATS